MMARFHYNCNTQVMCIEAEVEGEMARCTSQIITIAYGSCHHIIGTPTNGKKIRGVRAHATVDTLRSTGVQKLGWMALYVVGRRAFRPLPSLSQTSCGPDLIFFSRFRSHWQGFRALHER